MIAERLNRRLFIISLWDLEKVPYGEIVMPALARRGWEITLVAPGAESSVLRSVLPYRCRARNLTLGSRVHNELAVLKALTAARTGPYDVIYVSSLQMATRARLALLGPMFGKRLVYHNPDYYDPFDYPLQSRLEGSFCRKVDLYINNEFHRAYIARAQYRITCPILVTPPNLPAAWPVPAPTPERRAEMCGGQPGDHFVLMLHGGYGPLRMVPQLFKALAMLPPRYRLVMTGKKPRRDEVDEELAHLGLEGRVVRVPTMNLRELQTYTANADAGVLLYANNDLGNFFTAPGRLTEYMICGLPVLASHHTGLENLVRRWDLGHCVNANRPEAVAAAIQALDRDIQAHRYPAERMRTTFRNHLAFDHWEPSVCQAFEDLLDGRRRENGPPQPWWPGDALFETAGWARSTESTKS
jgi:glycosyltransferase involved in cell wall biosynthesis